MTDIINDIVTEIAEERFNQVERWGVQDHPSSGGDLALFTKKADHWKAINDARESLGSLTWDGILLEEVFEALSEIDPLLRRAELIQVAAVAAAEVESIDRALASDASPYAEAPALVEESDEDAA